MTVRSRSRRALIAGAAVAALSGLLVLVPGSPAGAVTVSNACINSAVPTDFSQVNVDMTATAPASVEPGASIPLTNINQSVALPGAIFVAGYNLGLLVVGENTVPGTIASTIEGTNTTQGVQNTSTEAISVTFTITDPDGLPGTGDETGTDATVAVTYDDMTWTAGPAGTILFREDTVTPQSATVAGIRITATIGGFLTVRFGCNPGTVLPGPPETIALIDPADPFASTASEETTTTTTSTTTTSTTTTSTTTTSTTTTSSTTTTTTPPVIDGALNVIVSGPTRTAAGDKTIVAKVSNLGTSTLTVCDTDVAWDIEVAGVNTTGSVTSINPGCKDLGPGSSARFRFSWTFGAGEVSAGAAVSYGATVVVADDFDTANNSDVELRVAK